MPDQEWQKRVRCGGDVFAGGHGIPAPKVKVNKDTGEIEPVKYTAFFALCGGKRTTRQHCVSNTNFIDYVAAEICARRKAGAGPVIPCGPNDGAGFCECDACRKLDAGDFESFSNEPSVTDRYIWFFNRVLDQVLPEHPDTKLAFYIYHAYMRPPIRGKPNPAIQGALAPISLDRVHGFSNPVAPEKSYVRWLYQEWGKLLPEIFDRGYWSNLACPGFPFIIVHRLRDEIPACHDMGIKGWRVETFPNYGPQFPSMYVAAKLMWDHTIDVDALLRDCFEKFFSTAAGPMGEYILLMDAALRDSDHCTGSSWDMPHFYPADLRARASGLLKEGAMLATGKGVYEERVRMITRTFNMLEAFIAMMDARARVDFPAAKSELDRLDAVAEELMNWKPAPMLSAGRRSTYVRYMNRFFRPCITQGYARVSGGNKLVATAADEWLFQLDPSGVGHNIGFLAIRYHRRQLAADPDVELAMEQPGASLLQGTGLVQAGCRSSTRVRGQAYLFWCGGVDELAKVWLNGQVWGISPGAAMCPFELDATSAVKPGRNVLVVCV